MYSIHWLYAGVLCFQDAKTTDDCAARLKAGASSSEGTDDQHWRGLDRLVCVDSTWQQATGIMKVSAHFLGKEFYPSRTMK